jgi:aryl-alcohol dehydrogenase-like predicted oxidoreductase
MLNNSKGIAVGTANLSRRYGGKDRTSTLEIQEASRVVRLILSRDDCSIETSPDYGTSEAILGELFDGDVFTRITTKVSPKKFTDAKSLEDSVHRSLENLKQKKIEGLLLHGGVEQLEENKFQIEKALEKLLAEGLVTRVGFSAYDIEEIKFAKKLFPIMTQFQILENIADQRALESEYMQSLFHTGHHLQVRSIFMQGKLLMSMEAASKYFREVVPTLEHISKLESTTKFSKVQICLAYARHISWCSELVVGIDSFSNFTEILAFMDIGSIPIIDFGAPMNPKFIDPRYW